MAELDFELADGWKEMTPPERAPRLLGEFEGNLVSLSSNLEKQLSFGWVGPVHCPIAYDPRTKTAFRYVCEERSGARDFSEIRAFSLERGTSFPLLQLPLNQWVLWLLEWIEGSTGRGGMLYGLRASDRSTVDELEIQHNLFTFRPGGEQLLNRPICRDAYYPMAMSRQRRELIFQGAEGIYLVGLSGERRAALTSTDRPAGRGAAFDPSGSSRVAIGGDGLYFWNVDTGECRQIRRQGQYPVWDECRDRIYFSESSSDVYYLDLDSDEVSCLVRVKNNHRREISFASPVKMTNDGRFLAVSLTGSRLRGMRRSELSNGERERIYEQVQELCVFDIENREFWRSSGFFSNLCWIEA